MRSSGSSGSGCGMRLKKSLSRYGRRFRSFWFPHGTGSGIRRWLYGMASGISFPVCGLGLRRCSQRLSLQFLLSLWERGMESGQRLWRCGMQFLHFWVLSGMGSGLSLRMWRTESGHFCRVHGTGFGQSLLR